MPTKHFCLTALSLILFVQILTIQVEISAPYSEFGQLAAKPIEAVKKLFSYQPQSVDYVSTKQPADSLMFVGDILLARNVEFLMNQLGADYPYRGLDFRQFSENPEVVGNFESAIPFDHVPTPTGMIRFSVDPQHLSALRAAGVTRVSLANNHSLDFGVGEFEHTVSQLEKVGISTFGHQSAISRQSVSFVEIQGNMVAILAFHTLHTLPTYSELQEVFQYASARSDFQIAYVHWGDEYVAKHNSRQREAAERFIDAGADLIVGHHPHVVQDIQLVNDVPVFYSLGNYIFDQYDATATKEGLLLQLSFTGETSVSLIPVSSAQTLSQPTVMGEREHSTFLRQLAKISDPALTKYISSGYLPIGNLVASSSEMAIMSW
jgi:poly-gamma-glutamate synthesis protein (capsule biosynthesis protein)